MMYEAVDARNNETVEVQPERTVRDTCEHTRAVLCELIGQERIILSFLRGGEEEKGEANVDPTCFVEDVNRQNIMAERALKMIIQVREILGAG